MSQPDIDTLLGVVWLAGFLVCLWSMVSWREARPWLGSLALLALMRSTDRLLHASEYEGPLLELLSHATAIAVLLLICWLLVAGRRARAASHQRVLLEGVFDAAAEGIWVLDSDGCTVGINSAAERLTGWREEDVLGRASHPILHHTRADGTPYPIEECPIYRSIRHGEDGAVEGEVFWRRDGSSFPVEYTATPVRDERGRQIGGVQVFRDVTRKLQAQEQQRRAEERERRERQAFEVNDTVVQRLVVADLAMRMERTEEAEVAVRDALAAAKRLINDWAEDAGTSGLTRSEAAGPSGGLGRRREDG